MIYGAPFDRQGQVNREIRRGRPGLVRGRSEAVAPVKLRRGSRGKTLDTGSDGAPGTPGSDGEGRISRGDRIWSRPTAAVNVSTAGTRSDYGVTFTLPNGGLAAQGLVTVPATTDINALPRVTYEADSASANQRLSFNTTGGGYSGAVGFSIVSQFAFTTLSADHRWFCGLAESAGALSGDPSTFTGCLGVGQDETDPNPTFMHSGDFPAATTIKTPSALPTVVINRLYEFRLFWGRGAASAQISLEQFTGGVSSGVAAYDTAGSTDVPVNAHQWVFYLSNGSTFGINRFAFLGYYAEFHPGLVL